METCSGNHLSPEDGGYPNEKNAHDDNPHGTEDNEFDKLLRTK
jgi:hypothetical protein